MSEQLVEYACSDHIATITLNRVLPHPGMLPSGSSIASPECSRRLVGLSNRLRGLRRLSRRDPNRLSCSIGEPAFPSRPGAARAAARNGGDERSGATRSHAQRAVAREHGEDGEHRTFPEVSTVAHSAPVGGRGRRGST
jgi:hypothetical protein